MREEEIERRSRGDRADLEGDGPGLITADALNVVPVVELVAESLRDQHLPCRISILDDDQVVRLEEGAPLLEEVEVADSGDHNVLRSKVEVR